MNWLFILIGFAILAVSADGLVEGASSLAKRFKVSNLMIGLTVVAFGTSMPEFVVNMVASFEGSSEIALTNILGSNTINVFIILGISAIVYPLTVRRSSLKVDIPLSIIAGVAVLLLALDGEVSRIDGIILLAVFSFFLYYTIKTGKKNIDEPSATHDVKVVKLRKSIIFIIVSLAGLVLGGNLIVKNAVKIATSLGVSESVIGVTIVALGTSLPELATSVVAAIKRNSDLAVGNVIGSNIFNVFFILGTSALISPMGTYPNIYADAIMAALGCLLVFLFTLLSSKKQLTRPAGVFLLVIYAAYLSFLLGIWGI